MVLGTGSRAPTRRRGHNGYLLRWDHEGLLFDPGEGTQRQFAFADVSTARITRIALTHLHGDHCLGLPGLLQRIAHDGAGIDIPIMYPASGQAFVDRLCNASIGAKSPVVLCPVDDDGGVVVDTEEFTITALPLAHSVPTLGWRVQERAALRLLPDRLEAAGVHGPDAGELLERGHVEVAGRVVTLDEVSEMRDGQSVAFVMDTGVCDNAVRLAEGADMLVCEATFLESESTLARETGHLTARSAATIAREAGARQLVLTHFSSRYDDLDGHLREAAEVFPDVVVAEDLTVVDVPPRRR